MKPNSPGPEIIAVVDDDEPLREALASVLKAAAFVPEVYESAEEFLASPGRSRAACLILDVRLPGMSGVELQKTLRMSNSDLPVIFVTAHGDNTLRDALLKAGAAGFHNKPVRSAALLTNIYGALGKNGDF